MKHFRFSFFITILSLIFISYLGYIKGGFISSFNMLLLTLILIFLEISLSFDNAVVNASILKHWNRFWQTLFLTVGIFIAVFGMRLLFPLLIVSITANLSLYEVYNLALNQPDIYSEKLTNHQIEISAFGSMFLLLVFFSFLFDEKKDIFWIKGIEKYLSKLGKYKILPYLLSIVFLILCSFFIEDIKKVFIAGIVGILTYLFVHILCLILEKKASNTKNLVSKGTIGGFLYLEVLDASFSFDGVIGAFAITKDIIIIMIGLGVGAFFVRSITIYLVEKNTLNKYIYLEHGAYYAIGVLALIMLLNTIFHIPEVISGTIGIFFVLFALYSSIKFNKNSIK